MLGSVVVKSMSVSRRYLDQPLNKAGCDETCIYGPYLQCVQPLGCMNPRPANHFPEAEVAVNACKFQSSEFKSTEFSATDFSCTGSLRDSDSVVGKSGPTLRDTNNSPDAGMGHLIVKIEACFASKLTGYSIWEISTKLLVSP
ncbi:hypothetical protein FACUT_6558 [Fusarium acutatum]|uniref:Uncharacterized protein n=1 Tax=Fusarium acutatum TaxID=78861 RepID=A0A8H4JQC4_9HYPO|nr:hypothetical protein FACUT_6558 [Fusarium acutatum]